MSLIIAKNYKKRKNSIKIFGVLDSYRPLSSRWLCQRMCYTQCPWATGLQHWPFYSFNLCQFEREKPQEFVCICISFFASKSEHFSCLLATWISSLVNCVIMSFIEALTSLLLLYGSLFSVGNMYHLPHMLQTFFSRLSRPFLFCIWRFSSPPTMSWQLPKHLHKYQIIKGGWLQICSYSSTVGFSLLPQWRNKSKMQETVDIVLMFNFPESYISYLRLGFLNYFNVSILVINKSLK